MNTKEPSIKIYQENNGINICWNSWKLQWKHYDEPRLYFSAAVTNATATNLHTNAF
jgi:hypothetical protein